MMKLRLFLALVAVGLTVSSCEQDVLVFPTPDPARVRIVNTTQDVVNLETVIDETASITAARGAATIYAPAPAGRPIGFVFKENGEDLRRDTLFYTLGGSASVILFARGSRTGLVEFRRPLQDTSIPADADPVVRFVHMGEQTDQFFTLEVFTGDGERAFPEIFDPGIASAYRSFPAGEITFEAREWEAPTVAASLTTTLERGRSYVIYTYDAAPPAFDQLTMTSFDDN